MKISDFLPEKDFLKLATLLPGWGYSVEYSEAEIDAFDEALENLEQKKGYDKPDAIFINTVIHRLRNHPLY